MTAAPRRPVLRYHGGKWKLADWIIAQLPPHRIYVEPFGGGASVLMKKERSYSEVYNDKWDVVVNVFRVLRDPDQAAELCRRIILTPYARAEFDLSSAADVATDGDPIERARLTLFRSHAGFGSAAANAEHSTGFRSNTTRARTTPAHDWASYPKHIADFVDRLRGVVIENRDAADCIRQHDTAETLFYVEPPYTFSTRNVERGNGYAHELSDEDHRALAAVLHQVKGMVVLSGYPCDLYDRELYQDWQRIERAAHADGARDRVEVLWINPAAQANRLPLFAQRGNP